MLTVAQAAQVLQVSEQTVLKELRAERLPGQKIGRAWRLSRRAVLAYLERVVADPPAPENGNA